MHSPAGGWRLRCATFFLLVGACAGPGTGTVSGGPAANAAPDATVPSILAPVRGDGLAELAWLQRSPPSPAIELRRAHILQQIGDTAGSLAVLNLLLYGETEPSPPVEAFARYLRGLVHATRGNGDEAEADRERAIQLAVDPELRALLGTSAPLPEVVRPAPRVAARRTGRPDILPRSAWGARSSQAASLRAMERPHRITIHHTAIPISATSQKAAAAQIHSVQGSHQTSEGWADIGYHFLIDPAGRIWEGRPLRWQGAHAGGDHNRGNIGVCVLGCFLRGAEGHNPTKEQAIALEQTLRWLCSDYDIDESQIYFHRQFKSTQCPGPRLEAVVTEIRRRMQQVAQR